MPICPSGNRRTGWVLLCSLAVVAGCGPKGPNVEFAEVKGTVTLNGSPLDDGRVIFFHNAGPTAEANIKPDGTYALKAAVGETSVFIDHREPPIEPSEGRPGMPMPGKSLVPDKYADYKTSGLKLTVEPGANEYNIEMVD